MKALTMLMAAIAMLASTQAHAGMVVTDNEEWAGRIRLLRDYGRRKRDEHVELGVPSLFVKQQPLIHLVEVVLQFANPSTELVLHISGGDERIVVPHHLAHLAAQHVDLLL